MESKPVLLSKEDLAKYPFLKETHEYVRSIGLTLEDLSDEVGREIVDLAAERIRSAIERRVRRELAEDLDVEILSFPVSLVMLRFIGDKFLTRRYAISEGKRVTYFLRNEEEEKILYIVMRSFNWRIRRYSENIGPFVYDYQIYFVDYVPYVPEYRGMWKIVNKPVKCGWVPVTIHEISRLVEEAVKRYVESRCLSPPPPSAPELFAEKVDEIRHKWEEAKARMELPSAAKVDRPEDAFPPCMRALLEEALAGKNLSHSARFALASFLLNIGKTVDEIIEIFRAAPDFREDIARYQVEHIAGLRGSKTKYTPFKCDNMRSLGLCRWKCRGVKHPLQFYRLLLRKGRVEYEELA